MDVITSNDYYYFAYLRNTRKMTMVGHLNVLLLISFDKTFRLNISPKSVVEFEKTRFKIKDDSTNMI